MYKVKLNFLSLTWVRLNSVCNKKPHQERMYKVKLNFKSLTSVRLKLNLQLKTAPGAHVQSQTPFFEFDLNFPINEKCNGLQLKSTPNCLQALSGLTWVWLKLNTQLKTNAQAHVQSQTQFFEFDLSFPVNEKKCMDCNSSQPQTACKHFGVRLESD